MDADLSGRIAVVTGANRGLGLEAVRQLARRGARVVLTGRDPAKGAAAAATLKSAGLDVIAHQLDVTDPAGIERLVRFVDEVLGRLDILINNAGITGGAGATRVTGGDTGAAALTTAVDDLRAVLATNLIGPFALCRALVPLMHGRGRVVNVSSGLGQLAEMGSGSVAYRISKTGLNALTRTLARELAGTEIKVNAVCPGWVRTDMGGAGAPRSVEQGVDTILWLATLPPDGPSGGFFRDRQPIPW